MIQINLFTESDNRRVNVWRMYEDGSWDIEGNARIEDGRLKTEGSWYVESTIRSLETRYLWGCLSPESLDVVLEELNRGANWRTRVVLEDDDPENDLMALSIGPMQGPDPFWIWRRRSRSKQEKIRRKNHGR